MRNLLRTDTPEQFKGRRGRTSGVPRESGKGAAPGALKGGRRGGGQRPGADRPRGQGGAPGAPPQLGPGPAPTPAPRPETPPWRGAAGVGQPVADEQADRLGRDGLKELVDLGGPVVNLALVQVHQSKRLASNTLHTLGEPGGPFPPKWHRRLAPSRVQRGGRVPVPGTNAPRHLRSTRSTKAY
jgi:hypothetical protein